MAVNASNASLAAARKHYSLYQKTFLAVNHLKKMLHMMKALQSTQAAQVVGDSKLAAAGENFWQARALAPSVKWWEY